MADEIYQPLTKADTAPLRYTCFMPETRKIISEIDKHPEVCKHINELYELIAYQMQDNHKMSAFIIAKKHQEAWKMYDRKEHEWDVQNRRFFSKEELEARTC